MEKENYIWFRSGKDNKYISDPKIYFIELAQQITMAKAQMHVELHLT